MGQYRALCQFNGELCVIDAIEPQPFGDFTSALLDAGVDEALYLDMGEWHYSWYRSSFDVDAIPIHLDRKEAATNWLVFFQQDDSQISNIMQRGGSLSEK